MHPLTANEDSRLLFWARVRKSAVPPLMIESATARRMTGDWAGACAAAHVDVDLWLGDLDRKLAAQVRADLRHLAPDLLRWHFPRVTDGLLRPGLTVSLARYGNARHLVARTPPAWAAAGERISLALWDPSRPRAGAGGHPHPHPDRRFRLDLHRHLWDARRAGELAERSGARHWLAGSCASHRWRAEAELMLRAEGRTGDVVTVRLSAKHQLALNPVTGEIAAGRAGPVLPDAATWVPPDLELLRSRLINADRLHPLVASALVPDHRPLHSARPPDGPHLIQCCGATHRIALVDGKLVPLDHDPDEIRREELLIALGGTSSPCLQAIQSPDEQTETAARQVAHGLYRAGLAGFAVHPPGRVRTSRARPRHASSR
jgi:hypothetical protein